MNIQPIRNIDNILPLERSKSVGKIASVKETDKLSREDIITSKDLSPEQKLEKLGIKPMNLNELATGLIDKLLDGEI